MRCAIAASRPWGAHWSRRSCVQPRAWGDARAVRFFATGCSNPDSAADDDDELVRLLVQDAFRSTPVRPAPSKLDNAKTASSGTRTRAAETRPTHRAGSDKQPRLDVEPQKAPPSLSSGAPATSSDGMPDATPAEAACAVTNSRATNAVAEPFASIRLRPADAGENATAPVLEWRCLTCQAHNTLHAASTAPCSSCGAPATSSYRCAAPPVRHVALMPPAWICQKCSHVNQPVTPAPGVVAAATAAEIPASAASVQRRKFQCQGCQTPFGGVQNWICPSCTHLCPRAATQCPTCFADRPASWGCPQCGSAATRNSVFASRCRDCGHDRVGKHSNSVVRCPVCAEWNDVRWELCSGCMAPLPAFAVTVRGVDHDAAAHAASPSTSTSAPVTAVVGPPAGNGVGTVPSAAVVHSVTVEKVSKLLHDLDNAVDAASTSAPRTLQPQEGDGGEGGRPRVAIRLPDRAWWCFKCNVAHRRNVGFCDICLSSAEEMRLRNVAELAALGGAATSTAEESSKEVLTVVPVMRDGDWQCPYCRALLRVTQQSCCGHRREVPHGYWLCERCCSTNHGDRPRCLGCSGARGIVCAWTCPECEWRNDAARAVCGQCGLPHAQRVADDAAAADAIADRGSSVTCPVCGAPNHSEKLACFRCRARLREVEWTCSACGHGNRKRNSVRCESCSAIHEFDHSAEVWLCQLCSSAVLSGGETPVRSECPRCSMTRDANATHYPARWRCECGIHNRARHAECIECGAQRRMEALHTTAVCPQCFRDTALDVTETCTHCSASLSSCFAVWEGDVAQQLGVSRLAVALSEGDADAAAEDLREGADLGPHDVAAMG